MRNFRDIRFRNANRGDVSDKRRRKLPTDVAVNSVGDYDQRRTGRTPDGKYAWFGCGNISQLRKEFPVYIPRMKRFKENGKAKGIAKDNFRDRKGDNNEMACGYKGKGETRNANLRFAEIGIGSPRNASFSVDETLGFSEENGATFADREVLISKGAFGRNGWEVKPSAQSKAYDYTRIMDTGLNRWRCIVSTGFTNIRNTLKQHIRHRNSLKSVLRK